MIEWLLLFGLQGFNAYEDSINDSKGFWGVLARKAKAILDDDNVSQDTETRGRVLDASTASQVSHFVDPLSFQVLHFSYDWIDYVPCQ